MTAYYVDSSALVKRYSVEKGTSWVISILRPSAGNFLYSSKVSEIEVCAALSRRRKGLRLTADYVAKAIVRFRRNFGKHFYAPALTDSIVSESIRLTDIHALRGYDAVQLATALETNSKRLAEGLPNLIFVTADSELITAAQVEGLTVENPNNYP